MRYHLKQPPPINRRLLRFTATFCDFWSPNLSPTLVASILLLQNTLSGLDIEFPNSLHSTPPSRRVGPLNFDLQDSVDSLPIYILCCKNMSTAFNGDSSNSRMIFNSAQPDAK